MPDFSDITSGLRSLLPSRTPETEEARKQRETSETIQRTLKDPDFRSKSIPVRIGILSSIDPDFKNLSTQAQYQMVNFPVTQLPQGVGEGTVAGLKQAGRLGVQYLPDIAAGGAALATAPETGGLSLVPFGAALLGGTAGSLGKSQIQSWA